MKPNKAAVLLLAHGSPESLDDVPEFVRHITGGRPLPEAMLEEVRYRYSLIGKSPLTEITMAELYPTLEGVLKGQYRYEERRLLRARVQREGAEDTTGDVLNDVVITKAALSRIIELDVTVDGLFVSAFRADGLIVSSPTGSTAYNLAAGGPIVHPALEAILLTPISPHMLTNRPLVINDHSAIEVRLREAREGEVHITLDGQRGFPLTGTDLVTVTRSPRSLRLVKASRDYFEVLRTKLKWGEAKG